MRQRRIPKKLLSLFSAQKHSDCRRAWGALRLVGADGDAGRRRDACCQSHRRCALCSARRRPDDACGHSLPAFAPASGMQIARRSLLPLDLARFKQPITNLPPMTTLSPPELVESLAAEYVFAQLCDATMHAFEAENEARMLSMTSGRTNIQGKPRIVAAREPAPAGGDHDRDRRTRGQRRSAQRSKINFSRRLGLRRPHRRA